MVVVFLMWTVGLFFPVGYLTPDSSPILPDESSVFLIGASLLQFAVSRWLDGHYDQGLGKNYFWMIWYPFFYWLLNLITAVTALPKVLFGTRKRARWVSPDRGVHQELNKQGKSDHG
jgi:biofilm PGA synthesis N-glycosyltransferase PgaC